MKTINIFTKRIFIFSCFLIFSFATSYAQRTEKIKSYCNLITKTISFMSSVTSEPISSQSLFNEEEGCYINGIQYEEKQTYTNFHKDIIKYFKESGTPEIKTIYPWQFNDEKQGYVTSYSTLYEDYKMNVVMFYDSGNKVCVIRVFTAEG